LNTERAAAALLGVVLIVLGIGVAMAFALDWGLP
jgi:hypothetical protein